MWCYWILTGAFVFSLVFLPLLLLNIGFAAVGKQMVLCLRKTEAHHSQVEEAIDKSGGQQVSGGRAKVLPLTSGNSALQSQPQVQPGDIVVLDPKVQATFVRFNAAGNYEIEVAPEFILSNAGNLMLESRSTGLESRPSSFIDKKRNKERSWLVSQLTGSLWWFEERPIFQRLEFEEIGEKAGLHIEACVAPLSNS